MIALVTRALGIGGPSGSAAPRRGLVGGTLGILGLNTATVALNFAVVLVLTRTLGAGEYGAYAVAMAWAMLLAGPAMLGLNSIVVRQVAAYETTSQWGLIRGLILRSHQAVGLAGCAIAAAAVPVAWVVYDHDTGILVPLVAALVLVPLMALTAMRQTALQGFHRVVLARLPDAVVLPFFVALFVAVAHVSLGDRLSATWAICATLGASVIAFVLGGVLLARTLPEEVKRAKPVTETRVWLRAGRPLMLAAILMSLGTQIGTILLGALGGADDAGVYNAAFRTATFTSFVFLAATFPLMPAVARLWAQGETKPIERLLQKATRIVFAVSAGVGGVLMLLAAPILGIFGSEFESGAGALRIIVVGYVLTIATGFAGLALVMTGNEREYSVATSVGVGATVLLTLVLVPVVGVDGAALGFAAGRCAMGVLATVFLWRRVHIYVGPARFWFGR